MKNLFILSIALLLLTGCGASNSSQAPDGLLLDQVKNPAGESPVDLDAIVSVPKDKAFRIRDLKNLEDLIKSSQVSREKTREAVFIGGVKEFFMSGPFSKAIALNESIKSGDRLQIFWPSDVVNDYIKVKRDTGKIAWLKYRDSDSNIQVILLEDFVIPEVEVKDARLIVITNEDLSKNSKDSNIVATSDEQIKKINHKDTSVNKDKDTMTDVDVDTNSDTDTDTDLDADKNVSLDVDPDKDLRADTDKPKPTVSDADEPTRNDPVDDKKLADDNLSDFEKRSIEKNLNIDITSVAVPTFRPEPKKKQKPKPPLANAIGDSTEQLLVALGIKATKIPHESKYLSNGKRNVSEVFPGGHHTFSACTFNPAQGSRKSRCYRELVLSKEFTSFLKKQGSTCARKAARLVFEKEPLKVLMRTNGGSVNRGNSRSLHHRGRALDVFSVYLYFKKGSEPKKMSFHKNSTDGSSVAERRNYTYYWEFESCWKKKIKQYHKAKACGSRGSGALTYRFNSDHNDHMHISLPVCKKIKARFKLGST